jgi:hypothetical protein
MRVVDFSKGDSQRQRGVLSVQRASQGDVHGVRLHRASRDVGVRVAGRQLRVQNRAQLRAERGESSLIDPSIIAVMALRFAAS